MKLRVARKICSQSAWVEIKMMPYSVVPHRGDSIKEAIRVLERRGEPVFYYQKKDYCGWLSGPALDETRARYNRLMMSTFIITPREKITQIYVEEPMADPVSIFTGTIGTYVSRWECDKCHGVYLTTRDNVLQCLDCGCPARTDRKEER